MAKAKAPQQTTELSDIEKLALALAERSPVITSIKQGLPDGEGHDVDFAVQVRGRIFKTMSTPASESEIAASVMLGGPRFLADVLRRLAISPTAFESAVADAATGAVKRLKASKSDVTEITDADFDDSDVVSATFQKVEETTSKLLPKRVVQTGGRSGSVSGAITVLRIDQPKTRSVKTPSKAAPTRRATTKRA